MVDHLPGHAAVDAAVLAGDEPRLVRAQVQRHVGDVRRIAHPLGILKFLADTFSDTPVPPVTTATLFSNAHSTVYKPPSTSELGEGSSDSSEAEGSKLRC